jgi:hypothetical protein
MKRTWILRSVLLAGVGFSTVMCNVEEEKSEGPSAEVSIASRFFTGKVVDQNNAAIVGATVTINGVVRTTTSTGQYAVSIIDNPMGYHVEIDKNGYAPVSELYLDGKLASVHTMKAVAGRDIDPTRANVIVDQASGIEVSLSANGLRSSTGAPAGLVRFTIIPHSTQTMPGDLTAVRADGVRVALQSVGAVTLQAADSQGNTLGLAANAVMTVKVPVPASAGGVMPSCVPLTGTAAVPPTACRISIWRFNKATSLWVQQTAVGAAFSSTATTFTVRTSVTPPPASEGLGAWNSDIEKGTPACTVLRFTVGPTSCFNFTVKMKQTHPMQGVRESTRTVDPALPAAMLYNLWPNLPIELTFTFPVGSTCATSAAITGIPTPTVTAATSTSVKATIDTGNPWPTGPEVGYPINSLGTAVTIADIFAHDFPCHSELEIIVP